MWNANSNFSSGQPRVITESAQTNSRKLMVLSWLSSNTLKMSWTQPVSTRAASRHDERGHAHVLKEGVGHANVFHDLAELSLGDATLRLLVKLLKHVLQLLRPDCGRERSVAGGKRNKSRAANQTTVNRGTPPFSVHPCGANNRQQQTTVKLQAGTVAVAACTKHTKPSFCQNVAKQAASSRQQQANKQPPPEK
eukprot:TRINITY_DN3969_c0_g1_i3.p1 TRINITY_DN3969_c0_g1~~TRINITY_DN3969_c0_g1_i3.p1  ORF type:complete len:194 (-),score=30.80 TRINITY_DN3969_c0_g1_i3:163-744(-)